MGMKLPPGEHRREERERMKIAEAQREKAQRQLERHWDIIALKGITGLTNIAEDYLRFIRDYSRLVVYLEAFRREKDYSPFDAGEARRTFEKLTEVVKKYPKDKNLRAIYQPLIERYSGELVNYLRIEK